MSSFAWAFNGLCRAPTDWQRCVLFDEANAIVKHLRKLIIVYLYVNLPLLDPVHADHIDEVTMFYARTSWQNSAASKGALATSGTALRGLNVGRCQWTIEAGGVGDFLLTTLIHNTFPRLHHYLDTDCYYSDDAIRKQAESLIPKKEIYIYIYGRGCC
jgi:hypothetical protein